MDDKVIVMLGLLAPAVIVGSIALFRGYSIKVWREYREDPDRNKDQKNDGP